MKKNAKLIWFFLLVISMGLHAQNWSAQNSGVTADLDDVFALSAAEAWVCGDNGVLLHTTDGGMNWNSVALTGADLQGIAFKDANLGIVVGDGGTVFQTTNGGQSWTLQTSPTASQLRGVAWGSGDVVWAAGEGGAAIRSVDNGVNWSSLVTGSGSRIRSIDAIGSDLAWIVGNGALLRHTQNAGASWVSQSPGGDDIQDVQFLDSQVGYISRSSTPSLLFTDNGGTTWSSRSTGIVEDLNGLFFINNELGWATSEGHNIYQTTDGGLNWTLQFNGTAFGEITEVHFASPERGWAVGDAGVIYVFESATGIEDVTSIHPEGIELDQNYPNPFNPSTTIRYRVLKAGPVQLNIFNAVGQIVQSINVATAPSGEYTYTFEAEYLPSGVYFYELKQNGSALMRKMLLMK
ncbi:MAG: YCF48-related protein [Calditrichia bacterium]